MKMKLLLMTIIAILGLATISKAQLPSYVPSDGLVGWWPFNGNANDESINDNNGTVNGATLTPDRFGNLNRAYLFNGGADFISVAHSNTLNISTEMTFSVWFKQLSMLNTINFIFQKGTGAGCAVDSGYYCSVDYNFGSIANGVKGFTYGGNNNCAGIGSDTLLNEDWHSLIITYSPSTTNKIYIDGQLIINTWNQSSNCSTCVITNSTSPLTIGNSFNLGSDAGPGWNGLIDDMGIWNRTLTQQEITSLYSITSIGLNEVSQLNSFSVFPNPAQSIVNVNLDAKLVGSIFTIYDNTGKSVKTGKLNSANSTIELNDLSVGIYTFSVGENKRQLLKIIKE